MKLYCQLIQENAGIQNISTPSNETFESYSQESNSKSMIQQFIYSHASHLLKNRKTFLTYTGVINIHSFIKEKYRHFKENILHNIFTSQQDKDIMFDIFSKTQRTIMALSKFLYIYRYKKAQVKITIDLYMNEISPLQKNVFVLFQNKFKYYFVVSDLVNIINRCLMNSPNFFSKPLVPKNPYNNIKMTDADLYNIYFFMKSRNSVVPPLIQNFFLCNMDYNVFKEDNEPLIRELYIRNYVYTTHYTILYQSIEPMLKLCKEWTRYLSIHDKFPKNKLVNIMLPYLHLYYLHLYYIEGTTKKENSYSSLKTKLRWFVKYNPYFGRKSIKINRNGANNIEFNEDCIDFHKEYNESEFKKIEIRLNDPFDPVTNRSRHYSSTPIEREARIPRFNYQESSDSESFDEDDDNPTQSTPINRPNVLANLPSLLFRTSLHSIVNYEDDTYHISIRNNAVNGVTTTERSNESSEERSEETQANEESDYEYDNYGNIDYEESEEHESMS